MSIQRNHSLLIGNLHPFYKSVLMRAVGAGYALPSPSNIAIQNRMVKTLVREGIWDLIDYLYIHAQNSGSANMGRINWAQPLKSLATGSPGFINKKGVSGSLTYNGFDIATDRIAMINNTTASQFTWISENGISSVPATEHIIAINPGSAGNARLHRISFRTTPQVDYVFNGTSAGASTLVSGIPADNTFLQIGMDDISSVVHFSTWRNGINLIDNFPAGAGALPDVGPMIMQQINASRAIGIVGGGGGLYKSGKNLAIYQVFKEYMDSLATL